MDNTNASKSCYGEYDASCRTCVWQCKHWFDCQQEYMQKANWLIGNINNHDENIEIIIEP